MSKTLLGLATILLSAFVFAACNDTSSNMNSNANSNANTGNITTRTEPTATATPTPRYSEEQARQERERAKANKESIGQSLDDAWIHTKIVAKLIGDRAYDSDPLDHLLRARYGVELVAPHKTNRRRPPTQPPVNQSSSGSRTGEATSPTAIAFALLK